jgi:hypothetical protein
MLKVTRFFKNATILVFVVALGLAYYELTDLTSPVVLYRNTIGKSLATINSDVFFYGFSIFLIVMNILISIIVKLMNQMPLQKIKVPNADFWFSDAFHISKLRDVWSVWFYTLAILINLFLIFCVVKLWLINRGQGGQLWEWGVTLLVFFMVLITWGGFIVYRLRLRRVEFF